MRSARWLGVVLVMAASPAAAAPLFSFVVADQSVGQPAFPPADSATVKLVAPAKIVVDYSLAGSLFWTRVAPGLPWHTNTITGQVTGPGFTDPFTFQADSILGGAEPAPIAINETRQQTFVLAAGDYTFAANVQTSHGLGLPAAGLNVFVEGNLLPVPEPGAGLLLLVGGLGLLSLRRGFGLSGFLRRLGT